MLRGLTSCLLAIALAVGVEIVSTDVEAADAGPLVYPKRYPAAQPYGIPMYGDHNSAAHGSAFGGIFGRNRGELPPCHEPRVLKKIAEKWAWAEAHVLHTGQYVEHIDRVHQHAEEPGTPGFIDRRYCGATATLTDGRASEVVYLIETNQGFASHGFNVESCFPRYDPLRVHGQWCKSLRP